MSTRWLSWLIILTMLYLIYQARPMSAPVPRAIPAITHEKYPALAEATDVEGWKRKLNPDYAARMNCTLDAPKTAQGIEFKIIEDASGEGVGAVCGENITIELTIWSATGQKSYRAAMPLALGSRQIAAGLDYGLLGIKPGGQRTFILPEYALTRGKEDKPYASARKAIPEGKLALVTVKRQK